MNLKQKLEQIKSGKLTAERNVAEFGERIQKVNKDLNIYLVLNTKAIEQAKEIDARIKAKKPVGKLAGLCVAVKSNICVKDLETNCASKVLESWVAPFNASAIERLIEEDAIILGMVNMDEFACGSSGETSAFGPIKNPIDKKLIPGGSSAGSAAALAADLCDFSLGSDTGGSVRNPASHCGVVGLKPSYGAVSRYGLIDLSMSVDQIGVFSKSIEDCQLVFDIIKGQDNFDTTSRNQLPGQQTKVTTVGIVNVDKFCDKKISALIQKKAEDVAKANKWKIKQINLPLDIAIETYYVLVYSEFFSATRKFDGRRFGLKIENAAGPEVLRRILGGSEITKAEHSGRYYNNAIKAKNYVKEQFNKLFEDVDLIVLPTVPRLPHKIGEKISVEDMYLYDVLTIPANLGGICGISVPAGEISNIPVGIQVFAPQLQDDFLLEQAKKFE